MPSILKSNLTKRVAKFDEKECVFDNRVKHNKNKTRKQTLARTGN